MTGLNHNAKPGADGRHWQSWHLRFPCYQERMVRMAGHCRTEEAQAQVARLHLMPRVQGPWRA